MGVAVVLAAGRRTRAMSTLFVNERGWSGFMGRERRAHWKEG